MCLIIGVKLMKPLFRNTHSHCTLLVRVSYLFLSSLLTHLFCSFLFIFCFLDVLMLLFMSKKYKCELVQQFLCLCMLMSSVKQPLVQCQAKNTPSKGKTTFLQLEKFSREQIQIHCLTNQVFIFIFANQLIAGVILSRVQFHKDVTREFFSVAHGDILIGNRDIVLECSNIKST